MCAHACVGMSSGEKEAVDADAKVMSLGCHPSVEKETDMGQIHHDQCQTISACLLQNQGPAPGDAFGILWLDCLPDHCR